MLTYNKATCVIEVITPTIATEYLKFNYDNRKVNWRVVYEYAETMKEGKWQLNAETIKFAETGRLLDGQHRLLACVEANVPFVTFVARGTDEKVMATIDQQYPRSRAQIFAMSQIPNGNNISSIINKYLSMGVMRVTAMESAATGRGHGKADGKRKISAEKCLDEYYSKAEYWQELQRVTYAMYNRCKRMMSQSDVAAIIAHLNLRCGYELSYVMDFFNQLFYDEMTKLGVIRLLRAKLINDSDTSLRMKSQMRTQLIRKVWDCYKKGRDPKVLKWVKGVEEEKPFE